MPISWNIETFDSITSTQDLIKQMAREGAVEGAAVQALEQTGGYGRHGRIWESGKGNLYLSLLLKPEGEPRHIGQMGLVAGVAVAETIRIYLKEPNILSLKWPNDVLINGLKCAGILIETHLTAKNSLSWVAIGVGVNITHGPPDISESIEKYAAKPYTLNAFRGSFLKNIGKYYSLWSREGFEPIRNKWLGYAPANGAKVSVRIGAHMEEGHFHGIDEEGNLLLRGQDERLKKITAGEVYL